MELSTLLNLLISKFEGKNITEHVDKNGDVWLLAKDVMDVLGIKSQAHALRKLDSDQSGEVELQGGAGFQKYEIYTDGACVPNPGRGRYAFVVVKDDKGVHEFSSPLSTEITTNNKCEALAIISALKWLKENNVQENVTIYSDSMIYVNHYKYMYLNKKIKRIKNGKNIDLLESMLTFVNTCYKVKWIKGHNGNKWNEHADRLCSIPGDRHY
jgi:ribonuclease HI